MTNVVHLTTTHGPFDTRIFHKEATSLARAGYDVSLLVHHDTDETVDDVHIKSLGNANTRLERWCSIPDSYRIAKESLADIYHFHDPELLPVGVALSKFTSGKVIYDVHENYKAKILKRQWIPSVLRPIMSRVFPLLQLALINQLDSIITATEWIAEPLQRSNVDHIVPIRNFPLTDHITISEKPPVERAHDYVLIYVGGLRENRGLFRMIQLLEGLRERGLDAGLWLIGPFQSDADEQRVHKLITKNNLKEHVRMFGWIDYPNIFDYLVAADVGLAILNPDETEGAIPTKMFDYMFANIPVVASEMEAIQRYLPSDCGITVPYDDTRTQVEDIAEILTDERSNGLGKNGRKHVEEKYNWEVEKDRLLDLYDSLS